VGSSKTNPKKPAAKAPANKAAATKVASKAAPEKKSVVKAAAVPAKKPAAPAHKPAPLAKKPAPKAASAPKGGPAKPVPAGKVPAAKALAPIKKKVEVPKKAPAPVPAKAKKDEKPAAAAPAPAKGATSKSAPAPAKAAPVPVKAAIPAKVPKAPAVPKPKAPPRAKKVPVVLGPMEKAQRSLAATAARAAAKDKVPPSKALAAAKEAKDKAAAKIFPVAVESKTVPKKSSKIFFHEVLPGAERIIKRGDKTTATPIPADVQNRRRGAGGEESPEELVERIERELENQHIFKRNMLRPQLCTKCGINQVSERFTIDKELGYCDDCAEILHLGETKEARKIDFHPSLMKKDGEPAAEGEAEAEAEEEDDEDETPPAGAVPEIE
jgi:hypothetical protein